MRRAARALNVAVLGFLGLKCSVLALNLLAFPVLRSAPTSPPGPVPNRNWRKVTAPNANWWKVVGRAGVSSTTNHQSRERAGVSPTTNRKWRDGGGVSLLVPVRNEEANLRRTLGGFLAQQVDEVLLLDDGSTDGTAELVRAMARTHPTLRLLHGADLPTAWVGKPWACHQLALAATGDVLVFCDADVTLAPRALDTMIVEADRQRADVFSVFPRQLAGTIAERALVPLIDDVLLCLLPYRLVRMPIPLAATANGQLLAFRRAAYDRLGGHAAVRSSIVEDVRLARQTKAAGLRLGLALGGDAVSVRMYGGYAEVVAGIGKSLLPAHGGSRLLMALTASWHVVAYTLPLLRLAARPRSTAARAALALGLVERLAVNAKTGRRARWEAALVPVTPLVALPVYARAAGRTQQWKGRTYR